MKDAALPPSQVPISAVVDQTLAPVLILAADQTVAAVARTCAPVRNVAAAARNAALVPTLVAVRTCAPADHNEVFRSAPEAAASQSSPVVSRRRYRPWVSLVRHADLNRIFRPSFVILIAFDHSSSIARVGSRNTRQSFIAPLNRTAAIARLNVNRLRRSRYRTGWS